MSEFADFFQAPSPVAASLPALDGPRGALTVSARAMHR